MTYAILRPVALTNDSRGADVILVITSTNSQAHHARMWPMYWHRQPPPAVSTARRRICNPPDIAIVSNDGTFAHLNE